MPRYLGIMLPQLQGATLPPVAGCHGVMVPGRQSARVPLCHRAIMALLPWPGLFLVARFGIVMAGNGFSDVGIV